ncbi:hypothetical protein FRB99_001803 [Tulasnella sp. 403]|nr:hypothetical protein FRB99_001803 [Tulasnella sp. 403]
MLFLSLLTTLLSFCLLHVASSPIPGKGLPGSLDNTEIKSTVKTFLQAPKAIISHLKDTTFNPIIKAKVQNLPYEAGIRAIRYNPLTSAEAKPFNMFSKYGSATPMEEWNQMLNMARVGKLDPSSTKAADVVLQEEARKLLVNKLGKDSELLNGQTWLRTPGQ